VGKELWWRFVPRFGKGCGLDEGHFGMGYTVFCGEMREKLKDKWLNATNTAGRGEYYSWSGFIVIQERASSRSSGF